MKLNLVLKFKSLKLNENQKKNKKKLTYKNQDKISYMEMRNKHF